MISKGIILPLLIVIILSGIGGVLTAQKVTQNRLEKMRASAKQEELPVAESQDYTGESVTGISGTSVKAVNEY